MPTQRQKDRAFLSGYFRMVQTAVRREAIKNDTLSNPPEFHADRLLEKGFNREATLTNVQAEELAKLFFDEADGRHGFVIEPTGSTPSILAALTSALERAGVAIVDEEVE